VAQILLTSGPTRQYLDPVRYITNASSGRMGSSIAQAALDLGHTVKIVSGPVSIDYPERVEVFPVVTTQEMHDQVAELFPACDVFIGVAAPCDYMPKRVLDHKLTKTGEPLQLELIETVDIVATMGAAKRAGQVVVGFALETEDRRFRAIAKMQRKCCDLIVSNSETAIDSQLNSVEILAPGGVTVALAEGSKLEVAHVIMKVIHDLLHPAAT
jgi:phosphopantothenoylcysteine decarboxylase / phosphopantothenate---cysteine ligase